MELKLVACILLILFLNIATFDGLYLHLYKYKLYAREESKKEHLLHSLSAFLFPWTVYFTFLDEFKGLYLWFGVLLTFLSLVFEFFDLFEEKASRESMGGLSSIEYALHFAMASLRASYITLIFASKPATDWLLGSASSFTAVNPVFNTYFIYPIMCSGFCICALHFFLIYSASIRATNPLDS